MDADDPNEIIDRIAARLGSYHDPLLNRLGQIAADAYDVEWRAEQSGETEVLVSARQLRHEIVAGEWDKSLDAPRKALGDLGARLATWDAMKSDDQKRIQFVWALLDERRRVGGADFWPHAKAFASTREWGFGTTPPGIQRAIDAAAKYGVFLDDLGPGKPRGTGGGWGKRGES